jgi:uncharacterized SAM-binding protein YcdF (DUF218 family)
MFSRVVQQILTLIEPIGLVWLCLLILSVVLWRKRQRRFASATFAIAAFIYLVSTKATGQLLGSLEEPYAGVKFEELKSGDAIVLLGGGVEPSRYEAGGLHFTLAGDRLNMALDMARLRKAPALVLGGGGCVFEGDFVSESQRVSKWFEQLRQGGIFDPALEIIPLAPCADTHDEAVGVHSLAAARGWHRVLLVTSANHMRRASALFRTQGLEVEPVPCNFLTNVSTPIPPGSGWFGVPSWEGCMKAGVWMHEEIGWLEYRRRGWIKTDG